MNTKKIIFLTGLILISLIAVFGLEKYSLRKINHALEDFSPKLQMRIGDLDLLMPGRIRTSDVEVKLKDSSRMFLFIKNVTITPELSDLFKGRFVVKVVIQSPQISYRREILTVVREIREKLEREKKEVTRPVVIQELIVQDGTIDLRELLKAKSVVVISALKAEVTNIDLSDKEGNSPFSLEGLLQSTGELKVQGVLKRAKSAPSWSLDLELKSLELKGLNELLKDKLPLTFTKGHLDLFAEVRSQRKQTVGYVKPFFYDLDVIKQDEKFKGPRHVIFEILGA